jgi:glutamate racemase
MDIRDNPIGIFDSGIGGLTVAQAVTEVLPHENIIYFGDTAHLPYGDKSTAAIQAYSVKICDLLLREKCKLILIACNSASAAAYDLTREYIASKAKVLNVIDPTVAYVGQQFGGRRSASSARSRRSTRACTNRRCGNWAATSGCGRWPRRCWPR